MPIIIPGNPGNNSSSYFNVVDGGLSDSTSIVHDKFQSIFEPWGDYVFATVMIIIGELHFSLHFYFSVCRLIRFVYVSHISIDAIEIAIGEKLS
jgi:hypothetical protein